MAARVPAASPSSIDRSIFLEAVSATYRQRANALYAHLPVALIFLIIGWGRPGNAWLIGVLLLYTGSGLADVHLYHRRPASEETARRHARVLYAHLALLGPIYNAIFMNLAFQGLPHAMSYLALITALFCSGGAVAYQHLRGLLPVFLVGVMTPQVVYHLLPLPQAGGVVIALLIVLYIGFMARTTILLHRESLERLGLLQQLERARADAETLARTDALTGLPNRRAVFEFGRALFDGAVRDERPLSVVILDIDRFKSINDAYGHPVGDAVIKSVATSIDTVKRSSDVAGRIGGEEFVVILPNADIAAAETFAERLREAAAASAPEHAERRVRLTCSLGAAELDGRDASLDALVRRADAALYAAKEGGRDRTRVAPPAVSAKDDRDPAAG